MVGHKLTELMANIGTSSYTTNTSGSQHRSRVALVLTLVLFFFLSLFAVAVWVGAMAIRITVAAIAVAGIMATVCVTKECTLVVTGGLPIWRSGRGRGCVGALRRRGECRRVPLGATSRLFYIVPALAVLVELRTPARRHRRRCAVLDDGEFAH